MAAFTLSSPSFKMKESIPKEFTHSGNDISPELNWNDAPVGTKSFTLLVFDPDAPNGGFVHWVIFNIPATVHKLPSRFPKEPVLKDGTMQGMNHYRSIGYRGPNPPKPQRHSYVFTLYALDATLPLKPGATYPEAQNAMKGHILAEAQLIGTFAQ